MDTIALCYITINIYFFYVFTQKEYFEEKKNNNDTRTNKY